MSEAVARLFLLGLARCGVVGIPAPIEAASFRRSLSTAQKLAGVALTEFLVSACATALSIGYTLVGRFVGQHTPSSRSNKKVVTFPWADHESLEVECEQEYGGLEFCLWKTEISREQISRKECFPWRKRRRMLYVAPLLTNIQIHHCVLSRLHFSPPAYQATTACLLRLRR